MNIKKFFIIATLFVTSAFFVFADDIPFVTFSLGLTTGHTFYGYDSFEYTYKIKPEVPEVSETPTEETDEQKQEQEKTEQTDSNDTVVTENTNDATEEEITIEVPMKYANGTEILIGTTATVNFNVTKYFSLFADLDCLADLNWHDSNYSHHLDYSGSSGVKFYFIPKIPSISASVAYLFGQRADFFKADDVKAVRNTPAGNGLKFAAEYNFSRDNFSRFAPTVGCSWRYIPRGNNSADNIISAYVQANF